MLALLEPPGLRPKELRIGKPSQLQQVLRIRLSHLQQHHYRLRISTKHHLHRRAAAVSTAQNGAIADKYRTTGPLSTRNLACSDISALHTGFPINSAISTEYLSPTRVLHVPSNSMPHLRKDPRPPRYDREAAIRDLTAADPTLGRLIARAGPFTMKLASTQSPFEALLESIIYQQIHGKAAAAIHAKLLAGFAPTLADAGLPVSAHPTAQQLLDCPNEQLRQAGLSHNKALAVRDLAAKTVDGTVPTLARIRRMSDEAIIEHLTQVRGIGKWTVEMFLIFRLGRPDILPVSDYGVRKGFALTFQGLKPSTKVTPADLPKSDVMERRAKKWHPWCSVASWYLWRACELANADKAKPAIADSSE